MDEAGRRRPRRRPTNTINRPEVKNAITAAMRTSFCGLIEDADAEARSGPSIVTEVDQVFSAGVDFKEVAAGGADARARHEPGAALRAAAKPWSPR